MSPGVRLDVHGIDNVGVAVKDVDLIGRFFSETFGLAVIPLPNGAGARVRIGSQALGLFAADPGLARVEATESVRLGLDHVSIRVADVDALHRDPRLEGVRWLGAPESLPDWGLRLLGFSDPEGNIYYFVSGLSAGDRPDDQRP